MKMNTCAISVLAAGLIVSPVAFATKTPADPYSGHDMSTMQVSADVDLTKIAAMGPVVTESRAPVLPVTEADRKTASGDLKGHAVHDSAINHLVLLDQLGWQHPDNRNNLSWSVNSWVGGDIDRLWVKSEGERNGGEAEMAEAQFLWGHAVGPWWGLVAGIRRNLRPGSARAWAAVGSQGLVLYNFESEITGFVNDGRKAALRLGGEYDILLTDRLILQPSHEVNIYSQDDESRGRDREISDTELGLRLRYEVRHEFAPYIGVSWDQLYGTTSDMAKREGKEDNQIVFLAGTRI